MKAVSKIKQRVRGNRGYMRVIVVAAAVGAMCGVLFGGTVASADGPKPGDNAGQQTGRVIRKAPVQLGNAPALTTSTNVHKYSAGPARPGVSASLCDAFASSINQIAGLRQEAMNDYDLPGAEAYGHALDAAINDALDAGCFVVE
jgi:hypothetical protein